MVEREMKRLRQMAPQQAEYAVTTGYLEWLASMPWQKSTRDDLQLAEAEELLEREHHGGVAPPRARTPITSACA